jgi:hypothetical protein
MGRGCSDIRLHPFLTSAPDGSDWYPTPPASLSQKRFGSCEEEKHCLPLPEFEPRISQPVAILTKLSQLLQVRPTYNFLCDLPAKSTNRDFPL